jgi:hypothetical protein
MAMYKDLLDTRKDTRATLYGRDVLLHYSKEDNRLYMFSNMLNFSGAKPSDWGMYNKFWRYSYCLTTGSYYYFLIENNLEIKDDITIGGL